MDELKQVMKECLETEGYEVSEDKLEELWGTYQDCQLWNDDGEMSTGNTFDEVEDFVKYSPCVNDVFQKGEQNECKTVY